MLKIEQGSVELENAWWDLWQRDAQAGVFQTPAWLMTWRATFSEGDTCLLSFWSGGRLMALVPLYELEGRLLLWGAGTSDRLDGVFDPAFDMRDFKEEILNLGLPLDLFQLEVVSPLASMSPPEGWLDNYVEAEACYDMSVRGDLPRNMRNNVRYYRRRCQAANFDVVAVGPEALDDLVVLHSRRWASQNQEGIFSDVRVVAWQRHAMAALERAGMLRLYSLQREGKIAALIYVLWARERASYYIGGFDPVHADLSPGTVLVAHAMSEARRENLQMFDFLRGAEEYKRRFGAKARPMIARTLKANSTR